MIDLKSFINEAKGNQITKDADEFIKKILNPQLKKATGAEMVPSCSWAKERGADVYKIQYMSSGNDIDIDGLKKVSCLKELGIDVTDGHVGWNTTLEANKFGDFYIRCNLLLGPDPGPMSMTIITAKPEPKGIIPVGSIGNGNDCFGRSLEVGDTVAYCFKNMRGDEPISYGYVTKVNAKLITVMDHEGSAVNVDGGRCCLIARADGKFIK